MKRYAGCLFSATFAAMLVSPPSHGEDLPVGRLELVAVGQTTDAAIHSGAFDVYHLVINDLPSGTNAYDVSLPFDSLVPDGGAPTPEVFQPTTNLATQARDPIPLSFFVADGFLIAGDASRPGSGGLEGEFAPILIDFVVPFSSTAVGLGIVSGDALAVLVTEASDPRPDLSAFSGDALAPVPTSGVPFDFDGDGDFDIIDLEALGLLLGTDLNGDQVVNAEDHSILAGWPASGATRHPILFATDPTGDGVLDLLDLDALGANFGATGLLGDTLALGDIDGDRDVDLRDLDLLGAGFESPPVDAVPESTTAALLALGLLTLRRR